jgi:3-mercaptopyruvate sulfurtransferase SseA
MTNAAALVGGTKAWEDAGYPMEASEPEQNKNANNISNTNTQPGTTDKRETKPNKK